MTCLEHINDSLALSEAETEYCHALLPASRSLKRRQLLVSEGLVFPYLLFVEQGLLRSYLTDERRQEHVIQFAAAGSWIPDNFHGAKERLSPVSIDAIAASRVLLLPLDDYELLLERVPTLQQYFRKVMQERIRAMQLRVTNYLTHAAADKYRMFRDIYPDIAEQAPRHMIASYLGIQPETLSRKARSGAATEAAGTSRLDGSVD